DAAQDLVDAALPRLADPRARGRGERLRGDLLFAQGHAAESAQVLASAARSLADTDQGAAREAMAAAMRASIWAGPAQTRTLAAAGAGLPRRPGARARVADLLLEGYVARFTAGWGAAIAPVRAALSRLRSEDLEPVTALPWYAIGTLAAASLWDDSAVDIAAR